MEEIGMRGLENIVVVQAGRMAARIKVVRV